MSESRHLEEARKLITNLYGWNCKLISAVDVEADFERVCDALLLAEAKGMERAAVAREALRKIYDRSVDCSGRNGEPEDPDNGFKCVFSRTQTGRDWGGFCPGHRKIFDGGLAEAMKGTE